MGEDNKNLDEIREEVIEEYDNEQTMEDRIALLQARMKAMEDPKNKADGTDEQVKLIQMEIDHLRNEIAKGKRKNKNFNKRLFIANVKELARQNKVKFGDIEKASDTSVGYISRLDKPDNPNDPSAEFIATASKMLKVSVDDLMNKDFRMPTSNLSESEQYLADFLTRLINETRSGSLMWDQQTKKYLNSLNGSCNPIDPYIPHPLYDMVDAGVSYDNPNGYPEPQYEITYVSKFHEGGITTINGSGFYTQLTGTNATIYIMNTVHSATSDSLFISLESGGEREIYIVDEDGSVEPLCSSEFCSDIIKKLIMTLYTVVNERFSEIGVSKKSRLVINGFMNATGLPSI